MSVSRKQQNWNMSLLTTVLVKPTMRATRFKLLGIISCQFLYWIFLGK